MRRRQFDDGNAGRYKLLQRYADSIMVAAVDDTRCVDADPIVAAAMP